MKARARQWIDNESKRQREEAEIERKKSYKEALKVRHITESIRKQTIGDRHVRRIVTNLAQTVANGLLVAGDLHVQHEVLAKLIEYELLKKFLPPRILCGKESKVQAEIIENIRSGLNFVKDARIKDHRTTKYATLNMVVASSYSLLTQLSSFTNKSDLHIQ